MDFTPALMGAMLDRLGCEEARAVNRGAAFTSAARRCLVRQRPALRQLAGDRRATAGRAGLLPEPDLLRVTASVAAPS
jgi:hypothetical protein